MILYCARYYKLFVNKLETDSFVFFSSRFICSKTYQFSNQRVTFSLRFTRFTN